MQSCTTIPRVCVGSSCSDGIELARVVDSQTAAGRHLLFRESPAPTEEVSAANCGVSPVIPLASVPRLFLSAGSNTPLQRMSYGPIEVPSLWSCSFSLLLSRRL